MGRLTALKPRTAALGKRLSDAPVQVRERLRGRPWARKREGILLRDPLCKHCLRKGVTIAAVEVDHIVPVEQGGSDDDSNLQGLCHDCHAAKTADEQRARQGGGRSAKVGGWVESPGAGGPETALDPIRGFFSAMRNTADR